MTRQAQKHLTVRRGAIAILQDRDRFLLIRRAEGIPKGGAWCFPGGHVEPGETSQRAIIRELDEELGIRLIPRRRLGPVRVPGGSYVLVAWLFDYPGTPLRPYQAEISEVKWVTISEIRDHPNGLATNRQVLRLLALG